MFKTLCINVNWNQSQHTTFSEEQALQIGINNLKEIG